MRTFLLIFLMCALGACGQYGSLYLPKPPPPIKPSPTTQIKSNATEFMTPAA